MGLNKRVNILQKNIGSIGLGALIVFIAIVLIAGIAASVLIQTSTTLESQASSTGRDTTAEVSSGLAVYSVEGYAETGSDISKLVIMVRSRAGTDEIDLNNVYIELSDTNKKIILNYSTSYYSESTQGINDVFSTSVFPDDDFPYGDANNRDGTTFGILIIEDADGSATSTYPVINRGDKAFLCINTTGVFNDIPENSDIWGLLVPEEGYGGVIKFRTPNTFTENVINLQ